MVKYSPNKNPGPLRKVLSEPKSRERTIVTSKPGVYSNSKPKPKPEKAPKSKFKIVLNVILGIIFFITFLYLTGLLKIDVYTNEDNPIINTEDKENYLDSTNPTHSTGLSEAEIVSKITSASCKTRVVQHPDIVGEVIKLATLEVSGTAVSVFQTYPDEYGWFHNAVGEDGEDYISSYSPLLISFSDVGLSGYYELQKDFDCGSWTEYNPDDSMFTQCFRAKGQPETTSWSMKWDNVHVPEGKDYAVVDFSVLEDVLKVPCN